VNKKQKIESTDVRLISDANSDRLVIEKNGQVVNEIEVVVFDEEQTELIFDAIDRVNKDVNCY
jgi:hypothetical protein